MRGDIKSTIDKFFPTGIYENPLKNKSTFSSEHQKLIYDVIGEIKHKLTRDLTHASDGEYDFSEKVVIKSHVILHLSFLGPFAHLNLKSAKRHMEETEVDLIVAVIKEILDLCEFLLLSEDDILEEVPWLQASDSLAKGKVRVWNCLFCEY